MTDDRFPRKESWRSLRLPGPPAPRQLPSVPSSPPALAVDREIVARAKWAAIGLLVLCEVLAMALWFSASAVVPSLRALAMILSSMSVTLATW